MELKKTQLILCLLFLLSSVVNRGTGLTTTSIGAVLDTRSRIGREQMVALEVALRKFNTTSQDLLLNTTELESTDPLRAASSAQKLIQQGAQVIISTGTWPQVLGISDVGKRQQVPTVALTPSSFLNKPFLVQMSYPDSALVNCFAAIIKSYKWRRVIAVYEDDDYGTVLGIAQLLSHALQETGARLDYSLVFPPMDSKSDPSTIIKDEWHRIKERRVISTVYVILRMSENLVLSFFKEAIALGMLNNGSAWICGPDVTTLLDSTLFSSSFASKYMQGVIGVQPYVNESTNEYLNFKNDFQQTYKNKYENNGESETSFNPGVYAVRAYDAMHAIVLSVNKAKVNNSSLVNILLESNFTGLSGLVSPLKNEFTYETNSNLIFRVVNVVGKSYKVIGFWSNSSGFYNELQMNPNASSKLPQLKMVLWPGEATEMTPAGVRTLQIGILKSTTWGEPKTMNINGETTNVTSIGGFCIEVFIETMRKLNPGISYNFQFYPKPGNGFTYNDFVNKVYLEEVDIVVGDVTVTSKRMDHVSFTEPFIASGLSTIVPMKRDNVHLMLLKPFTRNLWITLFLLMFYNFSVIWYLERNDKKSEEHFRGPWYKQFGATFWIIGNTIFQNNGEKIGSFYSKIVILSWLLVVLIISSCFTASLSSILVANQLKPVVDTSKIGCDGDSFVVEYLKNVLNFKDHKIVPIENPDDYLREFEDENITAAYIESPYVPEFLSKHKHYAVYGETQMLGGFALVLRKGDPMTADMSKAIVELQEDGTIKKLEEDWFSSSVCTIGTVESKPDAQPLGFGVFWSLFAFSAGIPFITLVAFTVQKHALAQRKKNRIVPDFEEEMVQNRQTNGIRMHEL
ncbi:hypothetical protein LUZ63_012121 [Rhynchospora breviuscula]|uniref:Ionotropic glutamate receptor C-terminal domain-containing protein n=1 Tax=Rhynchospora breviuscula TaxID=2022672 RepID=A0A9Q0CK69_9POAL|nr:hypothetical protein LUZ63_012121 [Rhynchospora breviuscula]